VTIRVPDQPVMSGRTTGDAATPASEDLYAINSGYVQITKSQRTPDVGKGSFPAIFTFKQISRTGEYFSP
jgi:hypothetical protein